MLRLLLAALLLLPGLARAEFPDRPLRVVVGFPAGGAGDLTARVIAEMASTVLARTAWWRTAPAPMA